MCWRQLCDVGNGFDRFCHQHSLSFNISTNDGAPTNKKCHQYRDSVNPKIVTKIESPTFA